jgi:hypothetical protein
MGQGQGRLDHEYEDHNDELEDHDNEQKYHNHE